MTRIKFCGLTREDDVLFAEELGVDFIGLIFVPTSKRYITIERAKRLRSLIKHTKPVGVFTGQNSDEIASISQEVGLEFCQIYDAPLGISSALPGRTIIHAFRSIPVHPTLERIESPDAILLDGIASVESSEYEKISALPSLIRDRLFLAGGLTPQNISYAVQNVRPFAVDVCRGIESAPGIKDLEAMRLFVDAVRSASLPHS